MLHLMKLHPGPFELIVNNKKTIELRLNDEKRKLIKLGDFIKFTNNKTNETCLVRVIDLHYFDSFKTLYQNLDLIKCGYLENELENANHQDMDKYYSKDEQDNFGVVGIEIKLQKSYKSLEIINTLESLKDDKNLKFNQKLLPNIDPNKILGIKTPVLRGLAKKLKEESDTQDFLSDLPHYYHDENMLHAFLISNIKDYDTLINELEKFLPFIDNWAVCDSLICKIFKKHKIELFEKVKVWLTSSHTYTVRYAIKILKDFFLDEDFDNVHLEMVSNIKSSEYYIQMMIAWYFSEALVKRYKDAIMYLEQALLDDVVNKMTIQKAVDSFRIPSDIKTYIKTFRR